MGKINILVVPSDNIGGVGFYRSTQPHIQLEKDFPDDFSVTIDMNPVFSDFEMLKKYQIIHIHKALFSDMTDFYKAMKFCKENGIVTIMDIDDHWKLGPHHPQYYSQKIKRFDLTVKKNFGLFDYVTTTTRIFANEVKPFNKNVKVIPNAIDPNDERFAVNKQPCKFIRVGMIMGSSHEYDMELIKGMVNKLSPEVKEKVKFVLCGFDLRGTMKIYDTKTGESTTRPLEPQETVWHRYEGIITDNWSIVSPEYKNYLDLYIQDSIFPNEENEHYKRCWTKDIDHYYQHYSEVDILLAPLEISEFNKVKSQLKAIECCFSKTALIASDFGPYQIDLVSAIEKGGKINPNGNALLVDENKNHKDWAKYVEKLVKNPDLLAQLQNNIYETLHERFDLKNVTADRAKFYKDCVAQGVKYDNKIKKELETLTA